MSQKRMSLVETVKGWKQKMKIKICSRSVLEKMSGSGFGPRTAVISITDVNEKEVRFYREPDFLLRLCFDDINSLFDTYGDSRKLAVNLFSREQADHLSSTVKIISIFWSVSADGDIPAVRRLRPLWENISFSREWKYFLTRNIIPIYTCSERLLRHWREYPIMKAERWRFRCIPEEPLKN